MWWELWLEGRAGRALVRGQGRQTLRPQCGPKNISPRPVGAFEPKFPVREVLCCHSSPTLLSHWLKAAHATHGLSVNTTVDSTTAARTTVSYALIADLGGAFSRLPPMFIDHMDFLPLGKSFQ